MTTKTTDSLLRLKEELETILLLIAEREMNRRDTFAADAEADAKLRRHVERIHRATGCGEPPAYRARASVIRETEAVAS